MIEIFPLASGSSGNAYLVTDGGASLLLECGLSFKKLREALDFNLSGLDGCLISHAHQDHARAAQDLMKAGVDIFASKGTIDALGLSGHRVHVLYPKISCGLPSHALSHIGWVITPFDTQHDAKEPLGFLINTSDGDELLYASDTFYLKYRFEGLTHIMIEVNYSEEFLSKAIAAGEVHPALKKRIRRSHMSLETVKDMLKANDLSRVREIWLLHLSDNNSDAERFKREIEELTGIPTKVA